MPELLLSILWLLLYIVLFAAVIYAVIYVLGVVGITIPPRVLQLLMVAFGILVLIWLITAIVGGGGIAVPNLGG